MATAAATRVVALGRQAAEAARRGWVRLTSLTPVAGDPLEPLAEDAPALPGTSDRAFRIGLVVVSLSMVSALATYLILSNLAPIAPSDEVVLYALFINLVLVIAMVGVIAYQGAGLWRAWRRKVAGARLHVRIVALFSLIAALPALLLAIAATSTFSRSSTAGSTRRPSPSSATPPTSARSTCWSIVP